MPPVTVDDLAAIAFLVFLEGVLSLDNALVLALIVSPLPKDLQKPALSYGLAGAIVFRLMAISLATYLIHWGWVKLVGGAYLLYLAADYWLEKREPEKREAKRKQARERSFWMTVLVVELADIAFAVDSILTAVALTKKVWVVVTGGILGLIMMRFAATLFLKLLERFPRFEPTAYVLVFLIGLKLLAETLPFPWLDFHDVNAPAFWIFWGSLLLAFLWGFTRPRGKKAAHHPQPHSPHHAPHHSPHKEK